MKILSDNLIHIETDIGGEIGKMTIEDAMDVLHGEPSQPVEVDGSSMRSMSGLGFNIFIPASDGQLYTATCRQVKEMIAFPWKKCALFIPVE